MASDERSPKRGRSAGGPALDQCPVVCPANRQEIEPWVKQGESASGPS